MKISPHGPMSVPWVLFFSLFCFSPTWCFPCCVQHNFWICLILGQGNWSGLKSQLKCHGGCSLRACLAAPSSLWNCQGTLALSLDNCKFCNTEKWQLGSTKVASNCFQNHTGVTALQATTMSLESPVSEAWTWNKDFFSFWKRKPLGK
jgi:hypothetical protein